MDITIEAEHINVTTKGGQHKKPVLEVEMVDIDEEPLYAAIGLLDFHEVMEELLRCQSRDTILKYLGVDTDREDCHDV